MVNRVQYVDPNTIPVCTFTREKMKEPVRSPCGHLFEKNVFKNMFFCPVDGHSIKNQKYSDYANLPSSNKQNHTNFFQKIETKMQREKIPSSKNPDLGKGMFPNRKQYRPSAASGVIPFQTTNPLLAKSDYLRKNEPQFYYKKGDFESALLGFKEKLAIENSKAIKNPKSIMFYMQRMEKCLRELGDFSQALKISQEILNIQTKTSAHWKDQATTLNNIGICFQNLFEYEDALSSHDKSLNLRERLITIFNKKLNKIKNSYTSFQEISHLKRQRDESLFLLAISYNNIGNCLLSLGSTLEALSYYQEAFKASKSAGEKGVNFIRPLNNIANCLVIVGDFQGAAEYFQQVYDTLSIRHPKQTHPEIVRALNNLGKISIKLGQYQKALDFYKKALSLAESIYHSPHIDFSYTLSGLGKCFNHLGFFSKAMEFLERAFEIQTLSPEGRHFNTRNIALCLENMGHIAQALKKHEQAVMFEESFFQKNTKLYSEKRPNFANSLSCRAECLRMSGKYHESEQLHRKVLELRLKMFKNNHYQIADSYDALGVCRYSLGIFDRSLYYHNQAYRIRMQTPFFDEFKIAESLTGKGNALSALGRVKEGLHAHEQALFLKKEALKIIHPSIAESFANIASCFSMLNQHEKSKDFYIESLKIREAILGPEHPETLLSSQFVYESELFLKGKTEVLDDKIESIGKKSFIALISLARSYLSSTEITQIKFATNPTGFVRIHLPIPGNLSAKIESIRLNYWPSTFKIDVIEAPHSHPNYFESLILSHGYTHAVFKKDTQGKPFRAYRMFKNTHKERNIFFQGITQLSLLKKESTSRDFFMKFPKSLIHQVLSTDPGTLSLNCVYKNKDPSFFNVYIENESIIDPQVERDCLSSENAFIVRKEILEHIDQYLVKNENHGENISNFKALAI